MKTFANILVLAVIMFVKSTGQAADSSLELVLSDSTVSFTAGTDVTAIVIFRNIGDTNLWLNSLQKSLSVVWDGKEYLRDSKRTISYLNRWLGAEEGWNEPLWLADYLIPPEKLMFGRHTLAVRDMSAESNTLTILIVPVRKPNPNVKFRQTTTHGGIMGGGFGGGGSGARGGF